MTLIETKTLASATTAIQFNSIPQDGSDLLVLYNLRDTGTNGSFRVHETALSLNGLTTGFTAVGLGGDGGASFGFPVTRFAGWHPDAGSTSNTFGNTCLYLTNYTGSTNKSYSIEQVTENNGITAYASIVAGLWANTAAITSLTLTTQGTNLAIGSTASLYKITKGSSGGVVVS